MADRDDEGGQGSDEKETMSEAPSLDHVTWRDMRVGNESARDIFDRVQRHGWPAMPAFSFGGILGGEASISDTINSASGRGGGAGTDEGDGIANPWWRSLVRNPGSGVRRLWLVAGGVMVAVMLAVALSGGGDSGPEGEKSPLAAGTPRHETVDARGKTGAYAGPSPLRKRLQQVADAALAAGITLPMHTTFEVVRGEVEVHGGGDAGGDGGEGGGMDFIVSVISSEALEAKAAVASPPASAASSDPFDPRVLDPRLVVEDLPPSHSLVLNKFNTMRNHGLVITKDFRSQEEALSEEDFGAWYRVVEQLPAVGFYNSAMEAGASQRHKHMQVIPDDALWDYRPAATEAIPVDEPISRLVGASRDLDRVWRIPEFQFQHALTLLPTLEELAERGGGDGLGDPANRMAAHLRERYVQLLRDVGFDTSSVLATIQPFTTTAATTTTTSVPVSSLPPYNAILTTRWLMIIPRSCREWGGLDVNGMGFLGALLVREREKKVATTKDLEGVGVEAVRGPGALSVLEGVTFGRSSGR
eukprot:g12096.t1